MLREELLVLGNQLLNFRLGVAMDLLILAKRWVSQVLNSQYELVFAEVRPV